MQRGRKDVYKWVIELETQISLWMLDLFEIDRIVCPYHVQKGFFFTDASLMIMLATMQLSNPDCCRGTCTFPPQSHNRKPTLPH